MSSAVLFSGGLDSAVLLAAEARDGAAVLPIHVRSGLAWEDAEADAIGRLLAAAPYAGHVPRALTLSVDMRDVYPPSHWALDGHPPAYDTPDEDVYLEGRNIVLISKAAVLCARRGIARLALGPLRGNPFPDATPQFFDTMAAALSLGLDRPLVVAAPFITMRKADVVRLGLELGVPLHLTMSCMSPRGGMHCGACSKCRERREAFDAVGVPDVAPYVIARAPR
jgi:7-cyano-7-deazaguanine synthase